MHFVCPLPPSLPPPHHTFSIFNIEGSTKFVGFFVVALVGVATVVELWQDVLGPGSRPATSPLLPLWTVASHLVARIVGLIVVPSAIYCSLFAVFFASVPYHGEQAFAVDTVAYTYHHVGLYQHHTSCLLCSSSY